jgi:hypothetical protein
MSTPTMTPVSGNVSSIGSVHTCPNDGSTDFRHVPKGDANFICNKCGNKFTPEDLTGARFSFLKAEYAKHKLAQ